MTTFNSNAPQAWGTRPPVTPMPSQNLVKLIPGLESDDGVWRNDREEALHVSASDLERHAYCPLSWQLARSGKSGIGDAVIAGREKHAEIHQKIKEFKERQFELRRAAVIWSWWFNIIFVFIGDALIFSTIDDEIRPPVDVAKYLALLALIWLLVGLLSVYLPWRSWIKMPTEKQSRLKEIENLGGFTIEPVLQPIGFIGGWAEGGRIEASLLFGAIIFGLHAIGLTWAEDKNQAGFILIVMAMLWTLIASWQLQKTLLADNAMELARMDAGIEEDVDVAYSDDDATAGLLLDEDIGLRGRPDQIVIVDGEFIPVEQKTGKVPSKPHKSHEIQLLAYLHLVEKTTGRTPPYGVLRYGEDKLHQIKWDSANRLRLSASVKEVQRLMVKGGASRNHNRKGKCQSCSRRYACDQSLV